MDGVRYQDPSRRAGLVFKDTSVDFIDLALCSKLTTCKEALRLEDAHNAIGHEGFVIVTQKRDHGYDSYNCQLTFNS